MDSSEINSTLDIYNNEADKIILIINSSFLDDADFLFDNSSDNQTITDDDWKHEIKPILDYLLLTAFVVLMLGMGCGIPWKDLMNHVKRPVGLFIGLLSQFIILPLSAFCLLLLSGLSGLHATGILLISCCPGGPVSNVFTYFCDGDIALSVAMTCVSTFMGMGLMPANLWLYGWYFHSENLIIPYKKMSLSLVIITAPVALGMLLKWKFPRIAFHLTKLGNWCGLLISFTFIGVEVALFPNIFTSVPVTSYVIILCLPCIGFTMGYGLAYLCRRASDVRKTIAIECGVQNVPLALTIIALSFPLEMQKDLVLLPWLYALSMVVESSIICLTYHLFKRIAQRRDQREKTESELNQSFEEFEKEKMLSSSDDQVQMKMIKGIRGAKDERSKVLNVNI